MDSEVWWKLFSKRIIVMLITQGLPSVDMSIQRKKYFSGSPWGGGLVHG